MRPVSIGIGAALSTLLVLVALAVPDAVYPPTEGMDAIWRANVTGAMLFALTPAVVLLITTSRISSATRDRRLASLRLIGLDRERAAAVAAVEAAIPTAAGAVLAWALFWALGPTADRVVAAGPKWFAAPLRLPSGASLAVVVSVVTISAAIAAIPLLRRRDLLQERSPSARRRPSRWRLLVPGLGVALLLSLVVAGEQSQSWSAERLFATLAGGAVITAVGIIVATPVLTDLGASALVRTRRVPAVLAARGIQAEPLATTRLVAGLAVALYLVLGGSAVLLAFESTPQYRYALQTVEDGPQHLAIGSGNLEDYERATLSPAELREVEHAVGALPGVLMVTPQYDIRLVDCDDDNQRCHPTFFVGTCAELAQLMTVSGCTDELPGFITVSNPSRPDELWVPDRLPGEPDVTVIVTDGEELVLHLGPDLVQDVSATEERWVYQENTVVFIPEHVLEQTGAGAKSLDVVAIGGTEIRTQIEQALPNDTFLAPDFTSYDLDAVARVRLVVYSLSAMAIGTALLGLALTTIDHARERRHVVARQRAVGMPGRTLYAGQLLQVLIPLIVALTLATALGWLAVQAWSAGSGWPPLANAQTIGLVGATTALGGLLVALATIPASHTRLTASLLRRE